MLNTSWKRIWLQALRSAGYSRVLKNAFHLWQITAQCHKQLETLWGEDKLDVMFGFIGPSPIIADFHFWQGYYFHLYEISWISPWIITDYHQLFTWGILALGWTLKNVFFFSFFQNKLGENSNVWNSVFISIFICNSLWLPNNQVINQCQITVQSLGRIFATQVTTWIKWQSFVLLSLVLSHEVL